MISRIIRQAAEKARQPQVKQATGKWVWAVSRSFLMIGLSFVILYPILYMTLMAFRPVIDLTDPSVVWIPKQLTLDNIKQAAGALDLRETAVTTVIITLGSIILQTGSTALTGYGFARFQFPAKKLLFALLIFNIIVPPTTVLNPYFMQFRYFTFFGLTAPFGFSVNLINKELTFFIPALFANGIKSGLIVYIFIQFFKGMPRELEDAANIDGCGSLKAFLRIIIPNAVPVFVTVIIFSAVWYWNDYFFSSLLLPSNKTISVALQGLEAVLRSEMGTSDPFKTICAMQAGSLILISPLLIMYLFLQRFFIESIEQSGIVG